MVTNNPVTGYEYIGVVSGSERAIADALLAHLVSKGWKAWYAIEDGDFYFYAENVSTEGTDRLRVLVTGFKAGWRALRDTLGTEGKAA